MRATDHRKTWFENERFPAQALLLESHDGFLVSMGQFLDRMDQIESGESLSPRQVLRFASRLDQEFRDLQWGMGCHERYEESKLYPFLDERFGSDCQRLGRQHGALHDLGAECEQLLAAAAESLKEDGNLKLDTAKEKVVAYGALLEAHLEHEETLVIPLLLELSPEEFERFAGGGETCAVHGEDES